MARSERRGRGTLEFDRADSDFNERDRGVLDLLLPHLQPSLRRRVLLGRRPREANAALVSPREREILELVAAGRTNAEVAWLLRISTETVRTHLENAYRKLGVHTRTGAVAALFEPGNDRGGSEAPSVRSDM